jgi:hypothetical protein
MQGSFTTRSEGGYELEVEGWRLEVRGKKDKEEEIWFEVEVGGPRIRL